MARKCSTISGVCHRATRAEDMTNMRQVLKTDRLVLEPQSMARFDQWFAMERQRDEAWASRSHRGPGMVAPLRAAGNVDAYACGFYYLLDPVSGEMRGEAGFNSGAAASGPVSTTIRRLPGRRRQRPSGRGLAAEAMQALLAHHDRSSDASAWWRLICVRTLPAAWPSGLGFRGYSDVAFGWCSASAAGTGGLSGRVTAPVRRSPARFRR